MKIIRPYFLFISLDYSWVIYENGQLDFSRRRKIPEQFVYALGYFLPQLTHVFSVQGVLIVFDDHSNTNLDHFQLSKKRTVTEQLVKFIPTRIVPFKRNVRAPNSRTPQADVQLHNFDGAVYIG